MSTELFCFASAASVTDWSAIDDVVMGGVTRSHLRYDPTGFAMFEGIASLEHNGGFASVRSAPLDLAVPGAAGYSIELYCDGKRYKLNLRTDDAFGWSELSGCIRSARRSLDLGVIAALRFRSDLPRSMCVQRAEAGPLTGQADGPHDRRPTDRALCAGGTLDSRGMTADRQFPALLRTD